MTQLVARRQCCFGCEFSYWAKQPVHCDLMIYIFRERMLFNWLENITDIYTAELTTFADAICVNIQGAWHLRAVIVRNNSEKKKIKWSWLFHEFITRGFLCHSLAFIHRRFLQFWLDSSEFNSRLERGVQNGGVENEILISSSRTAIVFSPTTVA